MNEIQEIEVKARVANFDLLLQKLSDLGCEISLPITQNDTVYLPNNVTFSDISFGSNALRIRIEDGKALLTLKQRQKVELSAIEAETEVKDIPNTQKIIELLGYYEAIKINKKRRITKYNDYSICLDEVEELGNFIEVEKFSQDDGALVQEELFTFLNSLGIHDKDRERKGYDTLMFELYNEKKSF